MWVQVGNVMPQENYQTVQDVSERLDVAQATVRQWIKSGALRAIVIGKSWRIADADLDQFLIAHETAPRILADRQATGAPPRPGVWQTPWQETDISAAPNPAGHAPKAG